jgi:hypothetical protein
MRIRNVRKQAKDGKISLLADCQIRRWGHDLLYLSFDEKYDSFIYADASPFAAALLVPAMQLGEDLIIEGSVSQKLYEGLYQIMDIMSNWEIGLKKIKVKADKILVDEASPDKVASFFSGGVDSFYTYLKHKDDAIDPISHLILIRGNDIDLRNEKLWSATCENVRQIAAEGGVELIEVETNIRQLVEPIIITDYSHGGALAAVALGLRRGIKKMYIPSSFSFSEEPIPCGTNRKTDPLWGTEILRFEHDGGEARRIDKIEWQIIRSPLALKHLRVCYMNVNGAYNCGTCEKCLRTMVSLYAFDKLKDAENFPQEIDKKKLTEVIAAGYGALNCHRQNLETLRLREKNIEMQDAIEKGLLSAKDPAKSFKKWLREKAFYLDHMYFAGRLFDFWVKKLRCRLFKHRV